ncbi:hypothetical protein O4J56_06910 [Nocardiopsis sp. RSe5-2]|uniref:Uncharacterized protein n=1 Tax=Nocardiopsis endophytica TaxID=3018445 RepID=A0ABT4U1L3_9ACTN|nr:hypothetical protein [Nocardiopsis endophytica]MDA2810365.1 hypothetical protein [Nocardiopsis endophytica]
MPHRRRYRVRPAEPHEVAAELTAAFLAATTVPRRKPVPLRRALREAGLQALGALLALSSLVAVGALVVRLT